MSQPSEHLEALKQAGLEDILWGTGSEGKGFIVVFSSIPILHTLTLFGSIASGLNVENSQDDQKSCNHIVCNLSISYV